jgi:arsenate-mycothiol transferase
LSERTKPSVLFVCVKNGGKSQMAAAMMRQATGDTVDVYSAASLLEVGLDISDEKPKAIDPDVLGRVDRIITLGRDAKVDPVPGAQLEKWETDEPSDRGIDGIERMRLVRDDIAIRVRALAAELYPSGGIIE